MNLALSNMLSCKKKRTRLRAGPPNDLFRVPGAGINSLERPSEKAVAELAPMSLELMVNSSRPLVSTRVHNAPIGNPGGAILKSNF